MDLKQNESQSAGAESTHRGVNWRSKDVTQTQQQRPESPAVTLTWHACKYKVHKLHQRYFLREGSPPHHPPPTPACHKQSDKPSNVCKRTWLTLGDKCKKPDDHHHHFFPLLNMGDPSRLSKKLQSQFTAPVLYC